MHSRSSYSALTSTSESTENSPLLCGLTGDPLRQSFPVRVVLGGELPAAGVKGCPARLRRQWLEEQQATGRIAWRDQGGDGVKVLARLFLGPESQSSGQFL